MRVNISVVLRSGIANANCELREDYHIIHAKPITEEKDHEFPET